MKALHFIINSNILIALAAVALTLASQAQLGNRPVWEAYLVMVFFGTLADYNFHRLRAVKEKSEAFSVEKYRWAISHITILKILIILSLSGLTAAIFFVKTEVLFLLIPLSGLTLLYTVPVFKKQGKNILLKQIPGLKIFLVALVWTTVTVLIPVLDSGIRVATSEVLLLISGRFTFIFAIAIPFDIRDMETDASAGIKTIPVIYGRDKSLLIADISLILSVAAATAAHSENHNLPVLLAFDASVLLTFIFISSRKMEQWPLYYHGLLDGCLLLHGILLLTSSFFS